MDDGEKRLAQRVASQGVAGTVFKVFRGPHEALWVMLDLNPQEGKAP
jgi:hypothetical protein